ncbi:hypothetical protein AB3N04_01180 (plasmid) [Alkalihalophilus sp. As8PL]|uniref:Uncharacterized protein n=1 Tax=Alkalihalophilus sp. As8PL TaxID=3237103 RepID=A0AB39BNS9_9BACI
MKITKLWSTIKHSNIHMIVPSRWFAHNFKKRYHYMAHAGSWFSPYLRKGDFQVKVTIDETSITFLAYPNGEDHHEQLENFDKTTYLLQELDGLELLAIERILIR